MSPTGNSKKRFITQKSIMNNGELFKMICGAGNEDPNEVYKLCLKAIAHQPSLLLIFQKLNC